jgi:hypothetical protein
VSDPARDPFIGDLASARELDWVISRAPDDLPLDELRGHLFRGAERTAVARFGAEWVRELLSLLERGGVGSLARDERGRIVLRFAEPVPSADAAWHRATGLEGRPGT